MEFSEIHTEAQSIMLLIRMNEMDPVYEVA